MDSGSHHALLDERLCIVDLDDDYAAMLGVARDRAIGRPAIDFTYPLDHALATGFLQAAWAIPGMHHGVQRHVHADGRAIWVDIGVSRLGQGPAAMLVVSCRPMRRCEARSAVQAHYRMAQLLVQALDAGKRAFGPVLIGNPATEILLHAYIAEAEAQTATAAAIATRTGVAWPLAQRWLQALIDEGFAETETPPPLGPNTSVQLSPRAHAVIEALFASLVSTATGTQVPA